MLSRDAVKFAAMKVSSISGDARRVLDICRCVVYSVTFRCAEEQADGSSNSCNQTCAWHELTT